MNPIWQAETPGLPEEVILTSQEVQQAINTFWEAAASWEDIQEAFFGPVEARVTWEDVCDAHGWTQEPTHDDPWEQEY